MTTSAVAWPSEAAPAARQRAISHVRLALGRTGAATRVVGLSEGGSARLRLPRAAAGSLEGVVINTAGGIAGGDRLDIVVEAGAAADAVLTSAAAEKIYRSAGECAALSVDLRVGTGARLHWLPQETILFDRARLHRSFAADIAPDAELLLFEAVVFGRAAHGEIIADAALADRWRIRRGGALVYADGLRLDGPLAALLARPAIGGGARVLATCLYVTPDAAAKLEIARAALDGAVCECGAAVWNGLLAVRFLAPDISTLRADARRVLIALRGAELPRIWYS